MIRKVYNNISVTIGLQKSFNLCFCDVNNVCQFFYKKGNNNFQKFRIYWSFCTRVYVFYPTLGKSGVPSSNCTEVIAHMAMISTVLCYKLEKYIFGPFGVSSKTLKRKAKCSHKLTDKSKWPYFIHCFCVAASMDQPLLRKLWPV
jgi:hypothetical protein